VADTPGFDDDRFNPHAQRLIPVVEEFVTTFKRRAGRHEGKVTLEQGTRLRGEEIEQRPERFIEQELIKPVAERVLGYDIRFQPKGFSGLEGRIPDFTVLNLRAENFGEIKTPGYITKARTVSVEDLDLATGRPLLGIATDGFTWILYTAKKGEEPVYTNHERIYSIIRRVRQEMSERGTRKDRTALRQEALGFVDEFQIGSLKDKV
jgi:hypothetical protein